MKPGTKNPDDLISIIRAAKMRQAAERTRGAAIFHRRNSTKKANNWFRELFLSSFKPEAKANQGARLSINLIHLFDKGKIKHAIKGTRAAPSPIKNDEKADQSAQVKVQCDFGESQLKPPGQKLISLKRKSSDPEIHPVEIVKKARLDESIEIAIGYKNIEHPNHEAATSPTISSTTQLQPSQPCNELKCHIFTASQDLFEANILPVRHLKAGESRNVDPRELGSQMDCEGNVNAGEVFDAANALSIIKITEDEFTKADPLELDPQMVVGESVQILDEAYFAPINPIKGNGSKTIVPRVLGTQKESVKNFKASHALDSAALLPTLINKGDESINVEPLELDSQMVTGQQRNDEQFDINEDGVDKGEGGDDSEREFVAPE